MAPRIAKERGWLLSTVKKAIVKVRKGESALYKTPEARRKSPRPRGSAIEGEIRKIVEARGSYAKNIIDLWGDISLACDRLRGTDHVEKAVRH